MAYNFTPEKFARAVRWVVLGLLGYALCHALFVPARPNAPHTAGTQAAKDKDCNRQTSPFDNFAAVTTPLFSAFRQSLQVEDTKPGTGEAAQCGQHAQLRYMYATASGITIFNNRDQKEATEDLLIGGGTMLRGFEQGLIGMKPGGERTILIPPNQGFGAVKDLHALRDSDKFKLPKTLGSVTAKAWLMTLSPPPPPVAKAARIIDMRFGTGMPAFCGDRVSIDLAVYTLDGTRVFSTDDGKPVTFTLGHSELPYGIEQAVLGMSAGGQRALILPPAYDQPLDPKGGPSALPADFKLPHAIVLVEIGLKAGVEESAVGKPAPPK